MKPNALPPPGSTVRLVVKDLGEVYAEVLPVKMKSGRIAIVPWGAEGKSLCIAPDEIQEWSKVKPTPDLVQRVIPSQRSRVIERPAFARHAGKERKE